MKNRILGIIFHNLASKKLQKSTIRTYNSTHYRDYTVLVLSDDTSALTVIENLVSSFQINAFANKSNLFKSTDQPV